MGKVQKPFLFFLALFYSGLTGLQAQKVNVDVFKYSFVTPVIDGVEEEAWDAVDPVKFTLMLGTEVATVTAYWKALCDCDNIYVLISVEDDDHYPAWESGGNAWEYDKPEIYFDVNDTLVDGLGPATASSGHYQFSPGFDQDGYREMHEATGTSQAPGGKYAYVLMGESYVYEQSVSISSMSNKYGVAMEAEEISYLHENLGFDATVIDQDKDITTARQRTIWQSGDGSEAEAWNSMDESGTLTLIGMESCGGDCWDPSCFGGIEDEISVNVAVQPNPVEDILTINADFDKVVIHNMLGQEISGMSKPGNNKLDVSYLLKGVYVIKVYKGERYIGAAKITKI
jgi:hypothetical protein